MSTDTKKAKIAFEVSDEEVGIIEDGNGSRAVLIKEFDLNKMHPLGPEDLKSASKLVVIGKPKCFSKGTQCMLYTGESKNVEDVRVGDVLMGDDSTPRTVLQTCKGQEEMFNINLINGEFYTVNKSHILLLKHKYTLDIIEVTVGNYIQRDYQNFYLYKQGINLQSYSYQESIDYEKLGVELKSIDDINQIVFNTSRQNRYKILKGVLGKIPDNCLYTHDSLKNVQKVSWLCRSLGYDTTLPQKIGDKYIINIDANSDLLYDFSVKSIGEGDYYGFTLDGNHRFLLNSFDVVRNTGKSTLIETIMMYKSHICPVAQVFSGSEAENGFYSSRVTDVTIFNKFDLKAHENFLKRQKIARQYLPNCWCLCVDDDVTDDPTLMRKPLMNALYKRGRHFNLIHILALQYPMDIPPGLRSCVDYVFILATSVLADRKRIYENFASGSIPTFQDFCDIMDVITEDHTALVIDNMTDSNKIEDRVFYFKADPAKVPKDFKMGCIEAWEYNKERLDPDYQPSIL